MTRPLHYAARLAASPRLVGFCLPWLMLMLVLGTLAQRWMGLYQAEKLFFAGPILWLGPVPLPGVPLVLGVLAIGLIARLILFSPWRAEKIGIILAHLGVLLLLLGGVLTALDSEEGYMILGEGEEGRLVSDYHARRLMVWRDATPVFSADIDELRTGQMIEAGLPFRLQLAELCRNCSVEPVRAGDEAGHGPAAGMRLKADAPRLDDQENLSGAMLRVAGAGEQDGLYVAFEPVPKLPQIDIDGHSYRVTLRKAVRQLPFSVRLERFEKFTYPGSDAAKEYESRVTVTNGDIARQAAVRMNEPLRFDGYTLYQSSFEIAEDGQRSSVFAVVRNRGRAFPYLACAVLAAGLVWHFVIRLRAGKVRF